MLLFSPKFIYQLKSTTNYTTNNSTKRPKWNPQRIILSQAISLRFGEDGKSMALKELRIIRLSSFNWRMRECLMDWKIEVKLSFQLLSIMRTSDVEDAERDRSRLIREFIFFSRARISLWWIICISSTSSRIYAVRKSDEFLVFARLKQRTDWRLISLERISEALFQLN